MQTHRVFRRTHLVAAEALETQQCKHGVEQNRLVAWHVELNVPKVTRALVLRQSACLATDVCVCVCVCDRVAKANEWHR